MPELKFFLPNLGWIVVEIAWTDIRGELEYYEK